MEGQGRGAYQDCNWGTRGGCQNSRQVLFKKGQRFQKIDTFLYSFVILLSIFLVLAAILAVPIPSNHPEFDKFIETDRTPQEKMARLAVLLSLQSPPTRQSLIKDAAR